MTIVSFTYVRMVYWFRRPSFHLPPFA